MRQSCRNCGKCVMSLSRHLAWLPNCRAWYDRSDTLTCRTTAVLDGDDDDLRHGDSAMDVLEDVNAALFHEQRKLLMLTALTRWSTRNRLGEKCKQTIKDDVRAGIALAVEEIKGELIAACGDSKGGQLASFVCNRLDLFDGIYTARQEKTAFARSFPKFSMFERKVGPLPDDLAYCTAIADWLELKMKFDRRHALLLPLLFALCNLRI